MISGRFLDEFTHSHMPGAAKVRVLLPAPGGRRISILLSFLSETIRALDPYLGGVVIVIVGGFIRVFIPQMIHVFHSRNWFLFCFCCLICRWNLLGFGVIGWSKVLDPTLVMLEIALSLLRVQIKSSIRGS